MCDALCDGIHWVLSILVYMLDAQYTGVYVGCSVYWCICWMLSILVFMLDVQYASVYVVCLIHTLVCML